MRIPLYLSLAAGLIASPLVVAEELPAAVRQIEAKGAKVVGSFDAPNGMKGYAAQFRNQGVAIYLTADG